MKQITLGNNLKNFSKVVTLKKKKCTNFASSFKYSLIAILFALPMFLQAQTSNNDNYIVVKDFPKKELIIIYPNPVRMDEGLTISGKDGKNIPKITSLYNVKITNERGVDLTSQLNPLDGSLFNSNFNYIQFIGFKKIGKYYVILTSKTTSEIITKRIIVK